MYIRHVSIILLIITSTSARVWSQNPRDTLNTKVGFSITITSTVLDENVKLFLHLPFCYKPDREYPLVLLLDGNTSFKSFASATELLAYDRTIPCCIVVGFPQYKYLPKDKGQYLASVDRLIDFFENDLFPQLEQNYRITDKIIWGQGHLLPIYTMITQPNLFTCYISDIPDLELISDKINMDNPFKAESEGNQVFLYLGSNSSIGVMNEQLVDKLKESAPDYLNWNYQLSSDSVFIRHVLTNYLTSIIKYFNRVE